MEKGTVKSYDAVNVTVFAPATEETKIVNEHIKVISKPAGVFYPEELLAQAGGNAFRAARLAMTRALELASGMPALIPHASSAKTATIALEEIAQGKIASVKNRTLPL